jgi:hypothetical protein
MIKRGAALRIASALALSSTVVVTLLVSCSARVDESTPLNDAIAEVDASPVEGSCNATIDSTGCEPDGPRGTTFYVIDKARGCIDYNRPAITFCVACKSATTCWVDTKTGVALYSPCLPPLLEGYCYCDSDLSVAAQRYPRCGDAS